MPPPDPPRPIPLRSPHARRIWLRAQRLDTAAPFGAGPEATRAAVEHLGYVQIDTINVIERSHHHILYTRIPPTGATTSARRRAIDKSVFEYWTHALAYIPTRRLPLLRARDEARIARAATSWFGPVTQSGLAQGHAPPAPRGGPLTIRDIDDDVLVEKDHPWASRKPSKRALQLAFYMGLVTISERTGMLKTYELIERHFGWDEARRGRRPSSADPRIPARPRAPRAGRRQPRFGLLHGRAAQARRSGS